MTVLSNGDADIYCTPGVGVFEVYPPPGPGYAAWSSGMAHKTFTADFKQDLMVHFLTVHAVLVMPIMKISYVSAFLRCVVCSRLEPRTGFCVHIKE